ncbi:MAG: right-handed parallel beta-helix repeat-containing protein [Candidatus Zixiibacteriota bacterium]
MRSISIVFCVFVVLLSANIAKARIMHVPADSSTIQGGINGAIDGDTVLVAPGTYYECINFEGKKILLISEGGPETTIIEKAYGGVGIVTFYSAEDSNSIIDGFSVRNAVTQGSQGAVTCSNSSPRIRNCIITTNSGIGLYCYNSTPIIEFSSIVENSGAGIYLYAQGNPRIENNLVSHNLSDGIFMYFICNPTIKNNTIIRNSGCGIRMNYDCSPDIVNTIVALNGYSGISSDQEYQSYPTITYCDVWNNNPDYEGTAPGTECISADPIFCDTATGNYRLQTSSPCVGTGQGGVDMGVFGIGCGAVRVTPGLNQPGPANSQVSVMFFIENPRDSAVTCDLSVSDTLGWTIVPTNAEITLNPGQVDSLILTLSIPNVVTGTADQITLIATVLPDSIAARASLTVAVSPRAIHVPYEKPTIQAGINASGPGDTVLVAPGTYHDHINFNGKAIVVRSEKGRDSTIISQIVDGISIVSFVSGEGSGSVLDGFTITGGNLEIGQGAGIKCQNSSPKILNNRIINNTSPLGAGIDCDNYSSPLISNNIIGQNPATSQGGGIRCSNHSSPVISQNVLTGNSATENGGGILCLNHCSPTITGNKIVSNTAPSGYGGGIVLFSSSTANISNNTIDKNSALKGGGIFLDNTSTATIVNTIVTNSLAGRGIRAEGPLPTIIYCDVCNNLNENYYGCLPGDGCISADPAFCDPNNGNYYLWIASPCVGAGQGGANMGAFGVRCSLVGDANGDGVINAGDVVYLINYLFRSGSAPHPLQAGDATCNGIVDSGDVVFLVNYLFKGGPPPCE